MARRPKPEPEPKGKVAWNWAGNVQTFIGFLPAGLLAAVTAYLGYVRSLSPLLLWLVILIAFTCGVILKNTLRTRRDLVLGFTLLGALSVIPLGLQVYQLRAEAENYLIRYDTFRGFKEGDTKFNYENVKYLEIVAGFYNENDFPVYYQLLKHHVRVNGRDSGLYGESIKGVHKVEPHSSIWAKEDAITFPATPVTERFAGRVHFVLAYGRDPKVLNKRVNVVGSIELMFLRNGALYAVLFTPDSEVEMNEDSAS